MSSLVFWRDPLSVLPGKVPAETATFSGRVRVPVTPRPTIVVPVTPPASMSSVPSIANMIAATLRPATARGALTGRVPGVARVPTALVPPCVAIFNQK